MKVVVFTLGCKVNQYESDSLTNNLVEKGYEVSTSLEFADVYIINTCAVTNEAEKKSRQTISKCKSHNPNAKIIVCGCASEKNAKQFEDIQGVTFISGVNNKLAILDNLETIGTCIQPHALDYDDNYISIPTKTRAYVKIQDGCNNFCSYCIIPYLRGRSRSRNIISILNEVGRISADIKEIVFTGIDISDYKIDNKPALPTLLEQMEPYSDRIRFRLGSLEQGVITQELINSAKKINLCPHFHLSLQSGNDKILKKMNRKYKTKDFLKTIKQLRTNFDNPSITTDIIVGFPEETNKDFKKTCRFVKKAKFSSMHIFPYSIRSGTIAEKLKQIDGKVKKERAKKLEKINQKLKKQYINSCKGKIHKVLIEEKFEGYMVGHTENYIKCYCIGPMDINTIVEVKIVKPFEDGAIAVLNI